MRKLFTRSITAKNRHSALLIIWLLVFSAISSKTQAQDNADDRTFVGGLILGANFSQVDGDNYAGYHKAGINGGGIVFARMGEHIAPSLEILYVQKGASSKSPQLSSRQSFMIEKYSATLTYAEVPILLNYFDRRRSHFGAGFSYSQLVSVKETAAIRLAYATSDSTVNFDAYPFRKADVNFVLNGSVHLVKGLFLNVRFQYSLFSIRKTFNPEFGRADQFNNLWAIRLMYLF